MIMAIDNTAILKEGVLAYALHWQFLVFAVLLPVVLSYILYKIIKPIPAYWALPGVVILAFAYISKVHEPYYLHIPFESIRYVFDDKKNLTRKDIYIKPSESAKVQNIVLILDESLRGDYLSLNTKDPKVAIATRYIEKLHDKGFLKNFGHMYPLGNCSFISGSYLFIGGLQDSYVEPTIFQYMKAAGFKTYKLDAPQCGHYNGMSIYDDKYLDQYKCYKDVKPDYQKDFAALQDIVKIINSPGKHFIVLTKQGSHIPFYMNYKEKSVAFGDSVKDQYLNAIYWNVNEFMKEFVRKTGKKDMIVFYLGDHGVNIGPDKGEEVIRITHCENNLDHAATLFNVGAFVYSPKKSVLQEYKDLNMSSATQVFSSILHEAGYRGYEKIYGQGLRSFKPMPYIGYTEDYNGTRHIFEKPLKCEGKYCYKDNQLLY